MASCDELNLDGRYKIKRVLSQTLEECFYEGWHVRIEKKVLIQKLVSMFQPLLLCQQKMIQICKTVIYNGTIKIF